MLYEGHAAFYLFDGIYLFCQTRFKHRRDQCAYCTEKYGRNLAKESPVKADMVVGVPNSSLSAASGYAEASGIPYEIGLVKNQYIARTFIQPTPELREQGVRMKLSAVRGVVEGKKVIMVDDSIVRGTTSRRIVHLLKEAGAKEVHVRIASPPLKYPCFYGIDIQTRKELIAANHTIDEIKECIGADSLGFLSEEGLIESIGLEKMLRIQDCVWLISTEIIRRRYMTMKKNIRNH